MKNEAITEKKDDYRRLSLFVDKITKFHVMIEKHPQTILHSYIILVVRMGDINIRVDDWDIKLKTNDALIIKKGKKLTIQGLPGEECWIVAVQFDGSGVHEMLRYLEFSDVAKFNVSGNLLAACLDSMIQTWEAGEYFRSAIILQTLLINIKDTEKKDYKISNLNEIYQYIQEHYAEPLDLNHLARVYGTSVSYFSRAFKEHFGIAPMAFVNKIRIHYARLFLVTSNMRIHDIAHRCGFEKMEYFCYVFKKSEGCTPSQYRANRKNADKLNEL